jgi:hypothetical protein
MFVSEALSQLLLMLEKSSENSTLLLLAQAVIIIPKMRMAQKRVINFIITAPEGFIVGWIVPLTVKQAQPTNGQLGYLESKGLYGK